ncbi:MAG: band-7 C-terminal domain-containing protein, partial [Myxococcota bacterium]
DRRATVAKAEGEKQARIKRSEGAMAELINRSEGEMQRRINEAEGRAQEVLSIARATAESLAKIATAIEQPGGKQAVELQLSEQYLTQMSHLANPETNVLLPVDLSKMDGLLRGMALSEEEPALPPLPTPRARRPRSDSESVRTMQNPLGPIT